MAWSDIPRWEKMTSNDLAEEAGFPKDCDAIYVNNCYELSYVLRGELAEMGTEDYARFYRGAVFKMLFQVHYEFLNGCDDVPSGYIDALPGRRCDCLYDWEPGDSVPLDKWSSRCWNE